MIRASMQNPSLNQCFREKELGFELLVEETSLYRIDSVLGSRNQ